MAGNKTLGDIKDVKSIAHMDVSNDNMNYIGAEKSLSKWHMNNDKLLGGKSIFKCVPNYSYNYKKFMATRILLFIVLLLITAGTYYLSIRNIITESSYYTSSFTIVNKETQTTANGHTVYIYELKPEKLDKNVKYPSSYQFDFDQDFNVSDHVIWLEPNSLDVLSMDKSPKKIGLNTTLIILGTLSLGFCVYGITVLTITKKQVDNL